MCRKAVLAVIAFLVTASCHYYRPVMIGDRAVPGRSTVVTQPCVEVSRTSCATEQCRGAHMDLVTLRCAGGTQTRCVVSFRCTVQ